MPDVGIIPNGGDGDRILLVQVREAYWLLEGEHHLNAMLSGLEPFPTPVRCVRFETEIELNLFLPEGQTLMSLWGINPAIITRLKENNELVTFESSTDDE